MTPIDLVLRLIITAYALWGWSPQPFDAQIVDLPSPTIGRSYPQVDLSSCHIEVDTAYINSPVLAQILDHEVGHCLGYFDIYGYGTNHSLDQDSLMYPSLLPGHSWTITNDDWLVILDSRFRKIPGMTRRGQVPMIATGG